VTEQVVPRGGVGAQLLPPGKTHTIRWGRALPEGGKQRQALKKTIFIDIEALRLQPLVDIFLCVRTEAEEKERCPLQLGQGVIDSVNLLGQDSAVPIQLPSHCLNFIHIIDPQWE
jgi:hypothetical protein